MNIIIQGTDVIGSQRLTIIIINKNDVIRSETRWDNAKNVDIKVLS